MIDELKDFLRFNRLVNSGRKRGCHCCPDWEADRAETIVDFIDELYVEFPQLKDV